MSSKTTNTQKADPWGPVQEPLKQGVTSLANLFSSGGLEVTPYEGDWVADLSSQTMAGREGLLGALGGTTDYSAATNPLEAIAGQSTAGTFTNNNPIQNTAGMTQTVLERIMPSINATFAGSGMTGSSLHQQNLAKGLASGIAEQELGIQQAQSSQDLAFQQANAAQQQALAGQSMQAAGMLPSIYGTQRSEALAPYEQMLQFGAQDQVQAQNEIDALIQQNTLAQGSEAQALKDYLSILSGVGGQFGTQTATQQSTPGAFGLLGAGLQAASLF